MRRLLAVMSLAAGLIMACGGSVLADEGMWPLWALDQVDFAGLKARGLTLAPEQIFNPTDGGLSAAIVQVGGGTGSFVSADGLIITNHHVAFGAIQQQSNVEQNYVRDGFLAKTRAEEIPAIGYNAYITLSFQDVTKEVLSATRANMPDLDRYKAIENKTKEIVKRAEQGGKYRCRVASTYNGLQYWLVTSMRIQDIRIVHVPPLSIGEFGGDIDNWMWPRHTGDFSFLRAYVAPDGSPAPYSEQNVPYKPRHFLPISSGPRSEGDLTIMLGYPGGTYRYRNAQSVSEHINYTYPSNIEDFGTAIRLMEEVGQTDSMAAIQLSGTIKGLNNGLKNSQGMLRGLKRSGVLERKMHTERELAAFIAADPKMAKQYGDVIPALDRLYADLNTYREKQRVFGLLGFADYYGLASQLYKWSIQKTKPDAQREPGFQERNVADMRRGLEETQFTLVPAADRKLLGYVLLRAARLPAGQHIAALDRLMAIPAGGDTAAAIAGVVDRLHAGTKVGDLEPRMKMFDMSTAELTALNDPFLNLARDLYGESEAMNDKGKAFSGAVEKLRPKLVEAYLTWKKGRAYPDANSTIRLAYGDVSGYAPADAVTYKYITTLTGVIDKETGEEPFANPPELLAAYKSGDFGRWRDPALNDVPVNFLTTDDGTGGNSGSPVMNGKGELIGLDFDSNWEGIIGDYYYDPPIKRSIVVDIRYVMYILDKVYNARSVLDELTIQ